MANHIINKQVLDISYWGPDYENFEELSKLYFSKIVVMMDKIFDKYASDDEVLRIDKLEIDAGSIKKKNFLTDFPEKVKAIVAEKILESNINNGSQNGRIKKLTLNDTKLDLLTYFLNNGFLPWWANKDEDLDSVFMNVIDKYPKQIKEMLQNCKGNETFINRLIYQFDEKVIFSVINLFLQDKNYDTGTLDKDLSLIAGYRSIKKLRSDSFRNQVRKAIFLAAANREFSSINDDFYRTIVQNISLSSNIDYNRLMMRLFAEDSFTKDSAFSNFIDEERNKFLFKTGKKQPKDFISYKPKKNESLNIIHKAEAAEYLVQNSGLVLLFPYLERFFINLKLLSDSRFRNLDKKVKAMHLLQYLVSGEAKTAEYLLVLNKVLCGIDINAAVAKELVLKEEEKKEANELLQSIINNWPVLKTSIDGLRDAFLKREGILFDEGGKWVLKVEKKSYDILIEQMPWSFSVVKFPWMSKILHVEW